MWCEWSPERPRREPCWHPRGLGLVFPVPSACGITVARVGSIVQSHVAGCTEQTVDTMVADIGRDRSTKGVSDAETARPDRRAVRSGRAGLLAGRLVEGLLRAPVAGYVTGDDGVLGAGEMM